MGSDYKTKVFRSGNSVAIRIPKAFGLNEGDEFDLIARTDGSFELRRIEQQPAMTLDELFGCMPGFMAEGRGDIEQTERDWSSERPSRDAA